MITRHKHRIIVAMIIVLVILTAVIMFLLVGLRNCNIAGGKHAHSRPIRW